MSQNNPKKITLHIEDQLKQTVFFLKLDGANVFKVRAYEKAIDAIGSMGDDFFPFLEKQNYTDIDGIGKGLSTDLVELATEERTTVLNELLSRYPESLYHLKKIKGLGSKKILKLYSELNVTSLADLEYACYEGLLIKLDGFGEKTQNKIIDQLQFLKEIQNQYSYAFLIEKAEKLKAELSVLPQIHKVELTGDLRRRMELASSIDIIIETDEKHIAKAIEKNTDLSNLTVIDSTLSSKYEHIEVNIYVCDTDNYTATLFRTTGSKKYLDEQFLSNIKLLEKKYANEQEIYTEAKKLYCLPELREANVTYIKKTIPNRQGAPVNIQDIQGVFHMHSTYSDGKNTLEEMVQKSIELKYQYIGISEHSQTAFYARGLSQDLIKKQSEEIQTLRVKYPDIHILHGIESDILPDGSLDYPDETLAKLDFVIASVHASMNQSEEKMTQRCLKALENPYCTILGHPTGRVLLGRDSFKIDLEAVFEQAGRLGKYIEINANPKRLDLDWRFIPLATKYKVKFVISPDAHSTNGLSHTHYGVNVARKGGLSKDQVINALSIDKLKSLLTMGSYGQDR